MALDLADGSRVALSVAKAAERQARLRLRLSHFPDVWELAPIVDIVRWDPALEVYRFTGQTLSEWISGLRKGNSPDLRQALPWCVECGQALMQRTLKLPRKPPPSFSVELARPPFRSVLKDRLRSLPLRQASVSQWISTLEGLTRNGLRQEELEQAGVLQRLARLDPSRRMQRAEVVTFVQLSHVVPKIITESSLAFMSTAGWRECCERIPAREFRRRGLLGRRHNALHLVRYRHRALGWSIVLSRYRDLLVDREVYWSVLDERGRLISPQPMHGFASPETAIAVADRRIAASFASWAKPQRIDRWQKFSLLGGEGYHELLFQIDDWTNTFHSVHFPARNVLVHARTSLRTTEQGARVLFVDEVQSDWSAHNHSARRGGSGGTPEVAAPFDKEWPLLALKTLLWWGQQQGAEGLMVSSEQLQRQRWAHSPHLLYRSVLPQALEQLAKATGAVVGHAPLKIHGDAKRVVHTPEGWTTLDARKRPTARPFRTRAQAERFACLTSDFVVVDLPVLWVGRLPQITAIPLYGAGSGADWFRTRRGAAAPPDRVLVEQSRSCR